MPKMQETLTFFYADDYGRLRHSYSILPRIVLLVSFLLSSSCSNSIVSGLQLRAAGAGGGISKDEKVTRRRRLELINAVSGVEYVVDVDIREREETGITVARLLAEFRYYGRTKKEVEAEERNIEEEEEEKMKMKNDIEVEADEDERTVMKKEIEAEEDKEDRVRDARSAEQDAEDMDDEIPTEGGPRDGQSGSGSSSSSSGGAVLGKCSRSQHSQRMSLFPRNEFLGFEGMMKMPSLFPCGAKMGATAGPMHPPGTGRAFPFPSVSRVSLPALVRTSTTTGSSSSTAWRTSSSATTSTTNRRRSREVKRRPAYGFSPADQILNVEYKIHLILGHKEYPEWRRVLKSDSEKDTNLTLGGPENLFDSVTDEQKMTFQVVFVGKTPNLSSSTSNEKQKENDPRTGLLTLRVRNKKWLRLKSYECDGSNFDPQNPYRGQYISVHPFYDVEWWKGMTFDDLEQELRRKDAEARRAHPDREFGVLDHYDESMEIVEGNEPEDVEMKDVMEVSPPAAGFALQLPGVSSPQDADSVAPRIRSQVSKSFSTFFSRAGRSSSTTS
ncbi:unnamed protein product, partial [Amoebophrya sp. A25]|eukprot:GSA25T00010253001.1